MKKKAFPCPVCGRYEFEEENDFDICGYCGWENDGVQDNDHNYAGGANELSVNEARIEFFLINDEEKGRETKEIREEYLRKRKKGDAAKVRKEYLNKLNRLMND
ncbi:MAG: hydrolase [Firmicutes bacterium]|nr:hydrolase [Bacillota bacterium]